MTRFLNYDSYITAMPSEQAKTMTNAPARSAGRPRALTLDDVLEAAIDVGLAGVNIVAVAAKLGVATGTIYNYVSSRDELVRLAAARRSTRPVIEDAGEPWPDLIRNHARRAFDLLVAEPQLLIQHMQGDMGPDIHLDYIESVLAALVRRGFTVSEAFRLNACVDTIVFGAATRATYTRVLEDRPHGYEGAIRRGLAQHRLDELPNIRACPEFSDPLRAYAFEEPLDQLIDSVARKHERG